MKNYNTKLVNKAQVSHLVVYNNKKGLRVYNDVWWNYTYYEDEYFKLFWLFPIKTLDEGLYRNGNKSSWYRKGSDLDKNKHYTLLGEVYTYPHIDIYSAGVKIHTEFFKDYKDLEKHLEDNYDNVNIKYNG